MPPESTNTLTSVDSALNAKNAEIAMWKKTHADASLAAEVAKKQSEESISILTGQRDGYKAQLDAIAARVAKEVPANS